MLSRRAFLLGAFGGLVAGAVLTLIAVDRLLRLSLMPEWVEAGAAVLSLVVAAVVAVFVGRQVTREIRSSERRLAATERRLTGVAWLARRSCEVTLRRGVGGAEYGSAEAFAYNLALGFTQTRSLDRLERHFREVLALSSELGGDAATLGARAFEGFIAAADRYNEIMRQGSDRTTYAWLSDEALRFLYAAVDELEGLAERRAFELPLPDVRTLGYSPSALTVAPPPGPPIPPPTTTPGP